MTMTFYCHCFLSADPDLGNEEPWAPANRAGTRTIIKTCFRPLGDMRTVSVPGNGSHRWILPEHRCAVGVQTRAGGPEGKAHNHEGSRDGDGGGGSHIPSVTLIDTKTAQEATGHSPESYQESNE